jgi:asparagine synthase (glutamine-hydrolysing)
MCGISGIVTSKKSSTQLTNIHKMANLLRHRGPDDEGFVFFGPDKDSTFLYGGNDTPENVFASNFSYTPKKTYSGQMHENATVAFGHRRLSIIDLSPSGHQPMSTPDQRYWITYNGEIYNYLELREELIKKGYAFKSESDTEVLLHAYVQWGIKALERLVGMFAFVIYDRVKNILFLARDFFGIKPLYYARWNDGFAFASEIKALLCLPGIKRSANPQKVYDYLRFGMTDHGSETLFADIFQLPAAHYLIIPTDIEKNNQPVRYWDINLNRKLDISFDEAANKVRAMFLNNVELHLRSDVPVGGALSGGIDSSSIILSMRHLVGDSIALHAFSYIAHDPKLSEEKWVDTVSQTSNLVAHKVRLSSEYLTNDLERLISIQDEPFGSTSIYAQYRVMQMAKEVGIKVMLDGQGADEIFGGYEHYWAAKLATLLYSFKWIKAFRYFKCANTALGKTNSWILINTGKFLLPSYFHSIAKNFVNEDLTSSWLDKKWFRNHRKTIHSPPNKICNNLLRSELYKSLMRQSLTALLRFEDRNSMVHSVESRVPFLTPNLVNLLFSFPEDYIIDSSGIRKVVFRKAMQGIVPKSILDRKDKIGFTTPNLLLSSDVIPWVEKILAGDAIRNLPFLKMDNLITAWQRMINGKYSNHSQMWRWINFAKWSEQHNIEF